MPQPHLPLFPADVTSINPHVSFAKREGRVYYFNGPMPVFSHDEKDYASFRMFTSQLVEDGNCTQAEIVRAFGISTISMKRYVKKYREGGPGAIFSEEADALGRGVDAGGDRAGAGAIEGRGGGGGASSEDQP